MVPRSQVLSILFWHSIIRESAQRNLNDSLGKYVDQEDKSQGSRSNLGDTNECS